jgi:hypothetical protein
VAGEGLIHYADPRDNQSIIGERKVITYLAWALIYDCSPNAARTLQLMREQAPRIDEKIKLAEPQRHEKCDTSAPQNK